MDKLERLENDIKRLKDIVSDLKNNMNIFDYKTIHYGYDPYNNNYNPCEFCMNNPKNNKYASGICHCALPAMHNIIY